MVDFKDTFITLKGNKIAQHCRLEATIHRVRPRFFDQVGHDTMYSVVSNKQTGYNKQTGWSKKFI